MPCCRISGRGRTGGRSRSGTSPWRRTLSARATTSIRMCSIGWGDECSARSTRPSARTSRRRSPRRSPTGAQSRRGPPRPARALAEWYVAMEANFEREGYHLYKDVLDRVGRRVLRSLDAPIGEDEPSPLPASLADWRPFPEVPAALRALADGKRYVAILSNVDRDLLELSIGRLGIRPDLAITAEDCGSYKPALGHWRTFLERSRSSIERTVHVGARQYHDMRPAAGLGLRTLL